MSIHSPLVPFCSFTHIFDSARRYTITFSIATYDNEGVGGTETFNISVNFSPSPITVDNSWAYSLETSLPLQTGFSTTIDLSKYVVNPDRTNTLTYTATAGAGD